MRTILISAAVIICMSTILTVLLYSYSIQRHVSLLESYGAEIVTQGYESGIYAWMPYSARFVDKDLSNQSQLLEIVQAINKSGISDIQLYNCQLDDSHLPTLQQIQNAKGIDLRFNALSNQSVKALVNSGACKWAYTIDYQYPPPSENKGTIDLNANNDKP